MTMIPTRHGWCGPSSAWLLLSILLGGWGLLAQPYGEPDRDEPGDVLVQEYLAAAAEQLHESFSGDVTSLQAWEERRPEYFEEYLVKY